MMLQVLLYLLIGSGAVLSVAGLLYGLAVPRRPRLIVSSVSLALLVTGLWRLESGNLPIQLPLHVVVVVDCKSGALDSVAANLSEFDNVTSASVVLFNGGSNPSCGPQANGEEAFRGLDLPAEAGELEAVAGRGHAAQCGIERTGIAAVDQLNDIACGIELALMRRGLRFRTRAPSVILFLESENQLGRIPRDAPDIESHVRETLARLVDQDLPIDTFFVEESRSIGRTASLETRNDLASEYWSAKTIFVLTLRDEALIGLMDLAPELLEETFYRLKGTFRSLGGSGCSELSELETQEYPIRSNWLTSTRENLIRRGERPGELRIFFFADHLLQRLGYGLIPRFECDGWIRLEVEAVLRIDGEDIRFPVAASYFRQAPVPSATLVLGNDEGRLTEDSWYLPGTSAPDAIEMMVSTSGWQSHLGYLELAPLVRTGCSFRMSELESGVRSKKALEQCIDETEALLLVEPTADDARWLEATVNSTNLLRERGRVVVVIGPPAQATSGSLPPWIKPSLGLVGSEQGRLVWRERQLHFVPDRGLLARAASVGIRPQQDAIDAIARQTHLIECGTSDRDAGIIDFSAPHFGLDHETLVDLTANPWPARLDMTGPAPTATYSTYSTASRVWDTSPSLETYLASHALLQLAEFVRNNGDVVEWEPSIRHATTVVLFATDVYQPDIDSLDDEDYSLARKAEIKRQLSAFFRSGAHVVVVELPTGELADVPEIDAYLKANTDEGGADGPLASVRDFAQEMGLADQVFSESLDNPVGILAKAARNSESISRFAFGRGFDSEMDCIGSIETSCDALPPNAERPAPERHLILDEADPLDAASVRTSASRETIYTEHHFGRSRIHTLAYSPLARDFIERDTQTTYIVDSADQKVMLDRCFLDSGSLKDPELSDEPKVRAWADGWGFTRLIDLVRHSAADILDESDGQIVAIEEAPNGQSVDVFVRARPGSNWSEPAPIHGYAIAPIDYDPVTRLARLRINRDPSTTELDNEVPLTIKLPGSESQERIAVKLLPLETSFRGFEIWRRVAEMSSGTGGLYGNGSTSIGRYGIGALSMLVLIFTLIMLSPLARRWTGFVGLLGRWFERQGRGTLKTVEISGFSVEAVLSEWGTNPGKAGTGRQAGIPFGVRTALKDDSLASVIWADLAGLVAPETFPFKKPRVRLRSLNQTKKSVVVVDDTGALRYPSPAWQGADRSTTERPGHVIHVRTRKSEFAARLAAVVARGLRQTGSVAVVGSSAKVLFHEVQPDADSAVLIETVRNRINRSNSSFIIHQEQFGDDEPNRLVLLIADPLCTAVANIEKLAEKIASNGGELRLALIVGESDHNPASLMLDLSSSGFIDRTEWTRYELAVAMEKRIAQLRAAINAHGFRLSVLDSDMTGSEVLAVFRDGGLLD